MLKLYNSYTKRREVFRPLKDKRVTMYNCGPTVYDFVHIGNLRSFLFADLLRRYLEYRGYKVKQVMNITDVGHMVSDADSGEDKMAVAARREGKGPLQVARFYEEKFFEDIKTLGIQPAWKYPRATEHIPEMIGIIEKLLKRGYAYFVCEGTPPLTPPQRGGEKQFPPLPEGRLGGVGDTCSVYYDLSTFPKYGKLSGNQVRDLIPGARVEVVHEKRNPYDFALWIYKPNHVLQWDTPWGRGYPGWHLECSAMSAKYLGKTIDIHTGGEDNKFPHHECEIAQSEGATGKQFVRTWLHVKHLLVNGKKMSKSLGNFYTFQDLLQKGFSARAIRYALISAHYRETLNFTLDGLQGAESALWRVDELVDKLKVKRLKIKASSRAKAGGRSRGIAQLVITARRDFIAAMNNDLNISKALAVVFEFVRKMNRQGPGVEQREILELLKEFDVVLGLGFGEIKGTAIPATVTKLVEAREAARQAKDWKRADALRADIKTAGFAVQDAAEGPCLKKL